MRIKQDNYKVHRNTVKGMRGWNSHWRDTKKSPTVIAHAPVCMGKLIKVEIEYYMPVGSPRTCSAIKKKIVCRNLEQYQKIFQHSKNLSFHDFFKKNIDWLFKANTLTSYENKIYSSFSIKCGSYELDFRKGVMGRW